MKPQSCFKIAGLSVLITLSGCASVGHYIGIIIGWIIIIRVCIFFVSIGAIGGRIGVAVIFFLVCCTIYNFAKTKDCRDTWRDPDEVEREWREERFEDILEKMDRDPRLREIHKDEVCKIRPEKWYCKDLDKSKYKVETKKTRERKPIKVNIKNKNKSKKKTKKKRSKPTYDYENVNIELDESVRTKPKTDKGIVEELERLGGRTNDYEDLE